MSYGDYDAYEFDDFTGDHAYFTGCTCEHDTDEHTWGYCEVDGCPCEGGWEE